METKGNYICNFCKIKSVELIFYWEDGYDIWNWNAMGLYKCNKCDREIYRYEDDYEYKDDEIVYFEK
jgi:hypothetical protein